MPGTLPRAAFCSKWTASRYQAIGLIEIAGDDPMTFDPVGYKQAIKEEWGRAAQGWHDWIPAINEWLETATEMMLDQAGVVCGSRVIDIAAGDGGQSISAARRVGPTGEVLATDIAPEFVELANGVAGRLKLMQLEAVVMDAEDLTCEDNRFDAAISRLGLMYLPDLQRGLQEIMRVLRPGGKLSVVVFTSAEKTPFFSVPVQLIRDSRGLPPPEPGGPGPFSLGGAGVLAGEFRAAGFGKVKESVIEAPLRFSSADECLRWRREASGTMRQMLSGLDQQTKDAIWDEVAAALRTFETKDGFESPCDLLICSGTT